MSESRTKWHSAPWWTAVGVSVSVIAIIVSALLAQGSHTPGQASGASSAGTERTPSASTSALVPSPSPSVVEPGAASTPAPESSPAVLYLKDIPESNFLTKPYRDSRDPVTVNGQVYASSYSFEFENCGGCKQDVEFNVPGNYSLFRGSFALTDNTRSDNVIDGIVYFSIYSATGDLLIAPQKVVYPAIVPFKVSVSGIHRLRLEVTGGDNWEYPCWCNANFSG